MKKLAKKIVTVTVLTSALVLGGFTTSHLWGGQPVFAAEVTAKGTINVNGQGKISIKPDIASVSIGVVTDANDAASAQTANAEIMEAVLAAVKAAGIEDKDIETAYFSVDKKYDYRNYDANGQPLQIGYTATNSLSVTVRNISALGNILDKATTAGANQISGVQFSTSTPELYYAKAMEAAVVNARSKASTLAAAIGVTIGVPLSVSESSYGNVSPIYSSKETATNMMAQDSVSRTTPISTGQLEISANVSVLYQYDIIK